MRHWEDRAGTSFINRLNEVILEIGRDNFTRRDLIEKLQCANFSAAINLDVALNHHFHPKPRSIRQFARRIKVDQLFAVKGVGVTTVFVWLCCLDYAGIDPNQWLDSDSKIPTLYGKKRKRRSVPRPR